MTPDNDKTLRGLFLKRRPGFDEWNDRRDYRQKFEKEYDGFSMYLSRFANSMLMSMNIPLPNILRDHEEEDSEISNSDLLILKLFPESKFSENLNSMMTFGMGRDLNGNFTSCDACGKSLNYLNSTLYSLCIPCDTFGKDENFVI